MEYLNSFFQNIKDKLANPFFGTFIIILIIHHWQFWYTLFNFDSDSTRISKINTLRILVRSEFSTSNIIRDIISAIIISFIGYIIVVGTRTFSLFIEFRIMPWITGKIISKNVVLKTTYDEIVKERDEYSDKYEEQRKNVRTISKNYDEQTELIKAKDEEALRQTESLYEMTKSSSAYKQRSEKIQNELERSQASRIEQEAIIDDLKKKQNITVNNLEGFKKLFFSDKDRQFWNSVYKFPPEVIEKVRKLKSKEQWKHFLSVANFVEFGGTTSGESLTEMKDFGLLHEGINTEQFTPIGEIIYRYKHILEDVE